MTKAERPSPPELAENSEVTATKKGKPRGRPFKKGQSGNPGGRPKDAFGIAELARSMAAEAIEELAAIMRARDLPPRARIAAIDSLLDRGLGKPTQPMTQQHLDAHGKPAAPILVVSRYAEAETAQEGAESPRD